ncbi:MAG: hypothetical protein N2035_06400 [Chthoniobacterales bacterium]|nr:hypothetical protein [Chthoniobacterales bacterium]
MISEKFLASCNLGAENKREGVVSSVYRIEVFLLIFSRRFFPAGYPKPAKSTKSRKLVLRFLRKKSSNLRKGSEIRHKISWMNKKEISFGSFIPLLAVTGKSFFFRLQKCFR